MNARSIRSRLATREIGREIRCLESAESTNDEAWEAAVRGAPHGLAIFAEEQRKGRGRHGRSWMAPRGASILCSVVLRHAIPVDRVPLITAVAALAASDAVRDQSLDATIRFPNDVYVGSKKIAGVLVESRFISGIPDLFIAGIGMNVNSVAADFPPDLRKSATSVRIERGEEVSRPAMARALLEGIERWLDAAEGDTAPLKAAWRERSAILGRKVRIRQGGREVAGTVEDLDPAVGIELRLASGPMRLFRGEHVEKLEVDS